MAKFSTLAVLAATVALGSIANAQIRPQAAQGVTGGGALPLPEGVNSVISIDAQNSLLVQSGTPGQIDYNLLVVRHVYSGGISALFGGGSIPTEQFVSPGITGANGGRNGGGFGARNVRGGSTGGTTGGNTGFNGFNRTGAGTTSPAFGMNDVTGSQTNSFAAMTPAVSPAMTPRWNRWGGN